jgi:hypothetical protein
MSTIPNITLAFSNLAGLSPLYRSFQKSNPVYTWFIAGVMSASFLHHLTETNEMGHMLRGVCIPGISEYGKQIRHWDMATAYSFFGYIVWHKGVRNVYRLVVDNGIVLSLSLACSFSCDYIIHSRPVLYTALHLPWHMGIYYIVYKIVDDEEK